MCRGRVLFVLVLIYMRANFGLILILPALLLAFQNCGRVSQPTIDPDPGQGNQASKVLGSTSSYKKITYDPFLEMQSSSVHLEINLEAGSLSAVLDNVSHACALDSERLNLARSILAESQVCEPGPLPPGSVSCLAIGVADIQLSNDSSGIMLRPVICNSGTFLCDGNDTKLRDLLADLRNHPPSGCQ